MVSINIEIDDAEIETLVKEEWYKKIRVSINRALYNSAEDHVRRFLQNSEERFIEMFKDAINQAVKSYTVRDMKQIQQMLKIDIKKKTK